MSSYIHSDMRRRLESGIEEARHPKGMSVHDGSARFLAHDISRLLLIIDKLEAELHGQTTQQPGRTT